MRDINVKKSELLDILRTNRANHRATFEKALDGYKREVIRVLEERLEEARKGKKIDKYIRLDEPTDQTADYDRVIKMMEMTIDEFIQLSENEFTCYVQDNWSWSEQFTNTTNSYL